jgi:hypothetical protein
MAALANSKHEHFAQAIAKGVSASKAYVSAGYSAKGAKQSAARMLTNADHCSRIRELQQTFAAGVVDVEIRKRSARVQVLQNRLDGLLALSAARPLRYADHAEGATGMVVRGYRGRNAKKEVWKFDGALETAIRRTLKQAAIEEGQWNERRNFSGSFGIRGRHAKARPGEPR